MFKTEKEFDSIISKEWGEPVIWDGITNLESYMKTSPKILWILKEGNEHKKENRNHREFHQNVKIYSKWKSTYKNIILSSYGILNNLEYKDLPPLNDEAMINDDIVLDKTALINVNKNGGGGHANHTLIELNYTKHKAILLQQIEGINPDVIINCSRVNRLFNDVAEKYRLEKKEYSSEYNKTINYAYNSEKLLINYWHPASRMKDEKYQKQLLDIYKIWKAK